MSLLSLGLQLPERTGGERRSSHPSNPSPKTLANWGYRPAASGVSVTESSALACIAVASCIKILAETSAMLPLKVYKRTAAGRSPDPTHPNYRILHDEPNPEMTSMDFRQTLTAHRASWGNAYAWKEWGADGYLKALWPLSPDRTCPERTTSGELVYRTVLPNGEPRIVPAYKILHLRGLASDGLKGYSPIGQIRESVGLALATEEYGARFFGNGAIPGIALRHPGELSEDAKKNIRESWYNRHQGLTRVHALAILEENISVEKIGIPPEDAQFLQTRQFQDRQIAKFFRIPLHMLADMEKGSGFSSVEQLGLEFVVYTLMPWLVGWEQECNRGLFLPAERGTWYTLHQVAGLLRGDFKSRNEGYAIGRQWGWYSADDIREMEDLNPLPDGQGKQYLVPLNMVPADQAGKAVDGKSARWFQRMARMMHRLDERGE